MLKNHNKSREAPKIIILPAKNSKNANHYLLALFID